MLDPSLLRNQLHEVANALKPRGLELDIERLTKLEDKRKRLQVETETLQRQRNTKSRAIGEAKQRGEDIQTLMAEVVYLGDKMRQAEARFNEVQTEIEIFSLMIPNIPHASVPLGRSEADNLEIRRWGTPPHFDFKPKDHVDLGISLGAMDFEAAVRIASARFVILSGPLARLQRALIQFMLDLHTGEHGYTEVYVPFLVNSRSMQGTGQLPKFAQDQITPAEQLPLKYVCHTPCFRSEAGSYGKDTRGMIRQHQFEKVELVHLARPQDSYAEHELLTRNAEGVLNPLALPYRVISLCAGDIGFGSAKTYDLEVWLPGQQAYRE